MDHITITDNGQKLLTRIAAGETTAVFTRIGTTDDQYTDDELQHLSALKNICQQADIVNVDVKDDTTIVISGYVDNKELEKGYYVAAVGIFAKAQGEEEILYGVSQVSNRPFLPGYSETLTGISIRFTLKVGNSSNIMVNVDETTSVTTGEFHAYRRNFDEALLRIEYPGFEDYSSEETELPDLEDAVSQIVSGKRITVLFQYIKASLKGLTSLAQRALSVAMGKNQARVFATVEALDAWLSVPENVDQLNVGDNFYITAMDVPDYWWDGTQKQKLETQKVDLTTYDQRISANANAISELNGNISAHNHDGRYLPPVWKNYDVSIAASNFQGNIYLYKRNGGYKQIVIMGFLTANLAADTGGRYIGLIPDGARPEVHQVFPGITKKGKTIWIHIDENGAINIENYSLNAAVLERNDYFYVVKVYY